LVYGADGLQETRNVPQISNPLLAWLSVLDARAALPVFFAGAGRVVI
jgi:hypothetical protein